MFMTLFERSESLQESYLRLVHSTMLLGTRYPLSSYGQFSTLYAQGTECTDTTNRNIPRKPEKSNWHETLIVAALLKQPPLWITLEFIITYS